MVGWAWTTYKDLTHKNKADHSRIEDILNYFKINLKRVQLKMEKKTRKYFMNCSQNKRQKKEASIKLLVVQQEFHIKF